MTLKNTFFIVLYLYLLGFAGLLFFRYDVIRVIIFLEMSLSATSLGFALASIIHNDFLSQLFALIIIPLSAAESAFGLSLTILLFRFTGVIYMHLPVQIKS